VDDTARGHIQAMEKGRTGESYIIAGPVHTLAGALQIAERITGIKAPRMKAAPAMLRAMSAAMSVVETLVPVPEQYSSETLRVSAGATYLGSSAKAERELGFTARPLEEGLRETLEYEMKVLGMRAGH
jgi:nucleoside-diphosphate-sugar epimerase